MDTSAEDQLLDELYCDNGFALPAKGVDQVSDAWLAARAAVEAALPVIKAAAVNAALAELRGQARLDDEPFVEPSGRTSRRWWRLGWLSANAVTRDALEALVPGSERKVGALPTSAKESVPGSGAQSTPTGLPAGLGGSGLLPFWRTH